MRKADVMFKLIKKRQKHADVILGWFLSTSDYIPMYLQFETYT